MIKRTLTAAATLAAATLAVAANAATFTQSVQFGPGPTDYNNASGTPTSLFFFDSNLGTLDSISLSSSYSFTSDVSVTAGAANASGNVRTQSGAQFASNDNGVTSVLNTYINNLNDPVDGNAVQFGSQTLSPIAYDIRGTRVNYNLTPGSSVSGSSTGSASTGPISITTFGDLAAFVRSGGGTFDPLFNTLSGLIISNSGGNVTATQQTTATGTLQLVYNYTAAPSAVPEPASWAMMVGGFGLLGGALRRRRSTVVFA